MTTRSRQLERESLIAEKTSVQELAARLRRRHHYMCRNRSGDYSTQDLTMICFAADTADRLAKSIDELLVRLNIKDTADEIYRLRCHLADLREQRTDWSKIKTLSLIGMAEDDDRERLMEMENLEFRDIVWKSAGGTEVEDREAEQRAGLTRAKTALHWRHRFYHLKWFETAQREDICTGEDQDFHILLMSMAIHPVKSTMA